MRQFTFYIGLNDKDTKAQKIDTIEAYKIASNLCADYFGGGTIYNAQGIYKHDDGAIVIENTLRIEVLDFNNSLFENVRDFVGTCKRVFNQESIAVQISEVNSELW